MNEKTEQMLQDLAAKLGTTTEYLWTILVNQAKYDIIVSVIQMALMFAVVYWTIKLHLRFSKKDEDGDTLYWKKEEVLVIPMVFAGIASVLCIVFFLDGFNDLISAIFNPEYWALKRIFNMR